MTIIASTEINKIRIQNSFNRILNNCTEELRTNMHDLPIIVCDDTNAEVIYNEPFLFKKAYALGFGGVKGDVNYQGTKYHLIVLNITNIDKLGINDTEFDGVFSHELGHLFNENPKKERLSVMQRHNLAQIENAKIASLKEVEFYADDFSKRTETSMGLISSMEKYLASENCINRELFLERIEVLNVENNFVGTIKGITSNGA